MSDLDEKTQAAISDIFDQIVRTAFAQLHVPTARDVISVFLNMRGLILDERTNEITNRKTGKIVGWFQNAEWSNDGPYINWTMKANTAIDFVTVKIDLNNLKVKS